MFIVHLNALSAQDTSSFVGFQGKPWISSHIDDLRPTSVVMHHAIRIPLSDLFYGTNKLQGTSKPLMEKLESNEERDEESDYDEDCNVHSETTSKVIVYKYC